MRETFPAISIAPRLTPLPRPPAPSSGWRPRAHGASHKGFVRRENEDHFLIANVTAAIQVIQASLCAEDVYFGPNPIGLYVVADGMGGHAAGERASSLALGAMERFILAALSRAGSGASFNASDVLRASFQSADDAVFSESEGRPSLTGMGTTMTAALVYGGEVHIGHAGDSRAYLLRSGRLTQLTEDHTFVNELRSAGFIGLRDGSCRALKHMVTNVIGGSSRGVRTDIRTVEVVAGDRLLLCSDGLTEMVPDERLGEILGSASSPDLASYRLIEAALTAGGHDNVTAVVIDVEAAN